MVCICNFEGLLIEIFVRHAPGIFEGNISLGHAALVNDAIAVAAKESIHVIEVTTAAVEKCTVIPLGGELLTKTRITSFTTNTFDDRTPRRWWNRQSDGF